MPENPDKPAELHGECVVLSVDRDTCTLTLRGMSEKVWYDPTRIEPPEEGWATLHAVRDDENDLILQAWEPRADVHGTPGATPTYTRERAATIRLTQAIHEYLDAKYPDRKPWKPDSQTEKNIDSYLDLFLGIHGDEGTPGMVFEDTGEGIFDWLVVREARRQLGFVTNQAIARAGKLLDSLLAGQPKADSDPGELVNREGGLMENVVYHAVNIAAERFNPDPADPGWSSEAHENALRDSCLDYTQAFLARRAYGA